MSLVHSTDYDDNGEVLYWPRISQCRGGGNRMRLLFEEAQWQAACGDEGLPPSSPPVFRACGSDTPQWSRRIDILHLRQYLLCTDYIPHRTLLRTYTHTHEQMRGASERERDGQHHFGYCMAPGIGLRARHTVSGLARHQHTRCVPSTCAPRWSYLLSIPREAGHSRHPVCTDSRLPTPESGARYAPAGPSAWRNMSSVARLASPTLHDRPR